MGIQTSTAKNIERVGETAAGMNDSAKAVSELANMAQELKTLLDRLQR
jgi:methyl-accepting chemotaxis protein